ncbi:Gfo/Idh/MocA family protein [Natrarchaeobius chitinivorans]|uniref:Gfo/Idh/MocA family oxidoreductase n=1 Tax=Natrarchaeobius chitinivorans TaxID=1679083 RepID=A0A3N6LV52_NATCH|nr:Gfo/Idh/MocA family oxidoreductase [Natrarchaeobius chitinivorans]RQG94248.1 gfo/Idh/MocA family oxidoreductase [Natrarchaeobius chitinivorans]
MSVEIGIIGAGNRGQKHAAEYATVEDADVVAIADVDEAAARSLARETNAEVYGDYRDLLEDADVDAVSICVHNNLHRPITADAAAAGCHVFCEKPMASTYTDARAMADAVEDAGVHLGVQNNRLFQPETRAARTLIDEGKLGDPYYARGVFSRRRGRPYVDGYGTPSFVSKESAGGGPIIDIGTYVIGQLLYLLGNERVERVAGSTFEHTDEMYAEELIGEDHDRYADRLAESGYDVEDVGLGMAHLEDGSVLSIRAAWHMYLPDASSALAGTRGGVEFDPFKFYTTTGDYEATVSLDIEEFERRQTLLESDSGYEMERSGGQFHHWIDTVRGTADNVIPTHEIALNSMIVMEGVYLVQEEGRELTADEIAERSESTAIDP